MELRRHQGLFWTSVTLALVAVLLLARISSFGIWDPWELSVADEARRIASGSGALATHRLHIWLVALGFQMFGVHEWAGRLPIIVCGIATVLAAWILLTRFSGMRAGLYAAVVTATSPLFLFNARTMLGDAPAFALQASVGLASAAAVLPPPTPHKGRWSVTLAWLFGLLVAVALAVQARGALLCALPPLAAVCAVAVLKGFLLRPKRDLHRAVAAYVVLGLTLTLAVLVFADVAQDLSQYSRWIGGQPKPGEPRSFESVLEVVFHSFAPWSAVLPIALGRALLPSSARGNGDAVEAETEHGERGQSASDAEESLRLTLLLWAFFGYGAHTLFISRYGADVAFLPVVALAGVVAMFMRDVERSNTGFLSSAVVSALLVGLVIRDYALFPAGPVEGMALDDFQIPEKFNPALEWTAAILPFAAFAFLALAIRPSGQRPDLRAPYRLLRQQWRRSWGVKAWLTLGSLVVVAVLALGIVAAVGGHRVGLTTIAAKWIQRAALAVVALPIAVGLLQFVPLLFGKIRGHRFVPALVAAALFGLIAAQGYLPALSAHFSPREVYESYNTLAKPDEELAEYRVGARAAAYYARGKVREISGQSALVSYLNSPEKRWAVFPADDLPSLDRTYRTRTGKHLFVVSARSARVLLATNHSIAGLGNQNFLAKFIHKEVQATKIQHPVKARLGSQLEFLGFDLQLPHGDYVGAGEAFSVKWYFRVLKSIPGNYRIFVHIDGYGLRLNGDHDPVDEKYPVRLWDRGDVIVDVQELRVPPHFRRGQYTIFLGFYSGSVRMPVEEGPCDDANRIRAGTLQVR